MRNYPENIYRYWQRRVTPIAAGAEIKNQIPEAFRTKYTSMQKIIISDVTYYTLPIDDDPDMGVSEKIPLISEEFFNKHIENETDLKPNALLKLPKADMATQVQSEGMALGIAAQALELTTASATMICYNNKPALLVPFDNMQPLKKLAAGDKKIQRNKRTDYEDSTLNPLGPGLSANMFADSFSGGFSLAYLTGDPDGVGGSNQNKGLLGRFLYIFDQAIFGNDSKFVKDLFTIDSRLRQKPKAFAALTRWTKGRNFSLLEDASIADKFDSLSYEKCEDTKTYIQKVIGGLEEDMTKGNIPANLYKQHVALITSAKNALKVVSNRIDNYRKMLPGGPDVRPEDIKNALVLENILNNPRLYTLTGRPYRSLFCENEHSLKVTKLGNVEDTDIKITFNTNLDKNTLSRLQDKLGEEYINYDSNTNSLTINKALLENLENVFYPENDVKLNPNIDYLEPIDSKILMRSYNNADDRYLIHIFECYKKIHKHRDLNDNKIIRAIEKVRNALNNTLQNSNTDLGLNMHMIKRFEFEAQKELQKILLKCSNAEQLTTQNQAFSAAIKLDCIQEFNNVCLHAAKNVNDSDIQNSLSNFMSKYANINLSNMDIESAKDLREIMLEDTNRILAMQPRVSNEAIATQEDLRRAIHDLRSNQKESEKTEEVTNQDTPRNDVFPSI